MLYNKENSKLPNLICPGAQRSGTSYIHNLLSQHKDIFGATAKEVHYFDINIDKGPTWYLNHYTGVKNQKYRLDTTPEYMIVEEIPVAIRDLLGTDIKFIFMLRNPVSRVYSEFQSVVSRDTLTFDTFLKEITSADNSAPIFRGDKAYYTIRRGFYARRIKAFLELFPIENMHFVIFEEFTADPKTTMKEICNFLCIDYDNSIVYESNKNPSMYTTRKTLQKADRKLERFYRFLSSHISINLKNRLKKIRNKIIGLKERNYEPMNNEFALKLLDIYKDDINELGQIIGRDMSDWLNEFTESS